MPFTCRLITSDGSLPQARAHAARNSGRAADLAATGSEAGTTFAAHAGGQRLKLVLDQHRAVRLIPGRHLVLGLETRDVGGGFHLHQLLAGTAAVIFCGRTSFHYRHTRYRHPRPSFHRYRLAPEAFAHAGPTSAPLRSPPARNIPLLTGHDCIKWLLLYCDLGALLSLRQPMKVFGSRECVPF